MTEYQDRLEAVRTDPQKRLLAGVVGTVLGLVVAAFHWLGLPIGGAAVAVGARDFKYGIAAGLVFGAVAWGVFLALFALQGRLSELLATGRLLWLSGGIAVGLSVLGSLVRGVV